MALFGFGKKKERKHHAVAAVNLKQLLRIAAIMLLLQQIPAVVKQ